MNPLLYFCGIGLLGMSVTAAAQPDVTPDVYTLDHVAGPALLPSAPPAPAPVTAPEPPVIEAAERPMVERFSRRRMPVRLTEELRETLAKGKQQGEAADTKKLAVAVPSAVITPLTNEARKHASFSRVMRPRATFSYKKTAPTKRAPKRQWIAFRVERSLDKRFAGNKPRPPVAIADGRLNRKTGKIELSVIHARTPMWRPVADVIKILALH